MTVHARWLGQAGFLIDWQAEKGETPRHLLIDPYLSDSLAEKYRGKKYLHERLRNAPVTVEELPPLDAVLCTHSHTDHMDPGTLIPLLERDTGCVAVVPRAETGAALERTGVGPERLRLMNAGETYELGNGITITAVASAHETLKVNHLGEHHFLGYVLQFKDVTLYHSGDCAPWDGQSEVLAALGVNYALLPVNGRDAERLNNGVPGNFTFNEAVDLCAAANIATLVPHHWGMFSFNTINPQDFDVARAATAGVRVLQPEHGKALDLKGTDA